MFLINYCIASLLFCFTLPPPHPSTHLSTPLQHPKAQYPDNAGWIVRTGETYTYDTPYHRGNSPNPRGSSKSTEMDLWVDFITELRALVCVKHQKQLFFRGWDNWASNADYYTALTDRIPTHSLLYFSIKHSASDFVR